ncbi:hypothetical protein [Niastella populi]|uniref:Transglutaminase-like domain-containing protein n=1 Tax=Niastella populi TaxID=550983 RepID=A0A1V9ETE8_9BACT|nr:hypothetical protein [Niastella populi]OQP49437.1 hypothetical protein A4R26_30680 [Niastella populi]
MKLSRKIGKVFNSRYCFVFLNGFLLASIVHFYNEDSYEKGLFESLAENVRSKSIGKTPYDEAILLNSLHLTHYLGERRSIVFRDKEVHSFKAAVVHPVTYDLMTTSGACGSFAYILSRLLNELKIPNRIAQMKVDGIYAGHNVVEAKTSKGWVVLDGLNNLYFKKADGNLASFSDVQHNWNFYSSQVPANYDHKYKYEGVRYTNWNKVPVLMPAIKGILSATLGKEKTEHLSLRTFFLRKFHILLEVAACLYVILLFLSIRNFMRRNPQKIKNYLSSFITSKKALVMPVNEKKASA